MHELSICRAINDIVTRHAAGRPVTTIHVRIGRLRQIVPDTLTYCWSLTCDGTALDGTVLEVESVPGRAHCTTCDTTRELDAPVLLCGTCGGHDVRIVSGEEFLITTLDLAEA